MERYFALYPDDENVAIMAMILTFGRASQLVLLSLNRIFLLFHIA